MSDHLANFLIAVSAITTSWLLVIGGICVALIWFVLWSESEVRKRERELPPHFTPETDEARAEMYRQADATRAAREGAERRGRGL